MSTKSTINQPPRWDDQQDSDGAASHNPGHHDYLSKFENNPGARQSEIDDLNKSFYAPSTHENPADNIRSLREKEQAQPASRQLPGTHTNQKENHAFNKEMITRLVSGKRLRGKGSLIALLIAIFGGGGFLSIFFAPNLVLINMKETMFENLNDQLHVVDKRSSILISSKLKGLTSGSCGVIKIECRFKTISDPMVEKFKAAGIEIKTTPKAERRWFNSKRGQILEINYIDREGVTVIKTAEELHDNLANNVPFRSAMIKAFNPSFYSINDKSGLGVIKHIKATKGLVITGDSDEENQKRVDAAVGGVENHTTKTIVTKKDENGKELYYDSDGNELTKAEVDAAREQSQRIEEYSKNGGTSAVLKNAVKGASIVGYMDSACTVYNAFRLVSAMSKVEKQAQAARFAMITVLTPADASKAGDISEAGMNYLGNTFMSTRPASTVVDPSGLNTPGSAGAPATIADPEAGMNATDGPGYRMMAYGEAPDLSPRASRFMIGGASVSLLDGVLQGVASLVNLGDPNPQSVSEKCGYIQNPVVRFTGLAIGIVAGVGTFGLTTIASIGGSAAIALALPFLESQAADIMAGNVFKGISNVDAGDAAVVGAIALFGNIAKVRGLKPLSATEGMKYAAASQESRSRYIESQQYLARATPFDITNKYSFMGSLTSSFLPVAQQAKNSASSAMISLASIIPSSLTSLVKPASAARVLDENYYKKCNDAGYTMLGLGADAFCGVHYGIDEKDLKVKPEEVAHFMAANNEIDTESEYGDAKDNGQQWNYVKYLKECPNRTIGWGDQDENQGNGWNCVDPAKETQNRYYRLYTIDKSVDAALDGEPIASSGSDYSANSEGVSNQGWTFPTVADATIKSGFQTNSRPDHNGVDISNSVILGQPVYAARDGKVTAAGEKEGLGYWIVIEHMVDGKMMSTVYGNLQKGSITVNKGDEVKAGAGQQIAKVGRGGEGTTAHLHFEVWDGSPVGNRGKAIEPTPIIEASRRRNMMEGAVDV